MEDTPKSSPWNCGELSFRSGEINDYSDKIIAWIHQLRQEAWSKGYEEGFHAGYANAEYDSEVKGLK